MGNKTLKHMLKPDLVKPKANPINSPEATNSSAELRELEHIPIPTDNPYTTPPTSPHSRS